MSRSREFNYTIDVAVIAPLIAGHALVLLLPHSLEFFNFSLGIYVLGYVVSFATALMNKKFRHLLIIPATGFAIGLMTEIVGVNTGIPFGKYEYVSLGGPRVLGVPLDVPMMWGLYAYLMYFIASSIVTRRGRVGAVLRVVYASLLMVVLDLAMDPFMISEVHAWIWLDGWGPKWFGVPASNFIGWFIVSFAIFIIHELAAGKSSTPKATALIVPYTCLVMFFASFIGPELAAPVAALIVILIAVPLMTNYVLRFV